MSDGNHPLVLIIDDDEVNRKVLEMLLRQERIDLLLAETGQEGLNLARRYAPDLILLDLVMPDTDGLEVLKQFKEEPTLKTIPVIIFTIVERDKTKSRALELGAADYVTKPFDMCEIIADIKRHLRGLANKTDKIDPDGFAVVE